MGQIFVNLRLSNPSTPGAELRCRASVDTGATALMLPESVRPQLGELEVMQQRRHPLADGSQVLGKVTTPVVVEMTGFEQFWDQPVFLPGESAEAPGAVLLGCQALEAANAWVDPVSHQLFPAPFALAKGFHPS